MPKLYVSIFDRPGFITKRELCALLNLDLKRPGLKFSPAEIKEAYKKRALRFHPDKQNTRFIKDPIPEKTCNVLMNDIILARDYMLRGEDNIPGKGFLNNTQTFDFNPMDWTSAATSILQGIRTGTSTVAYVVPWLSRLSSNYLMILLFSTFSDGQLNFRYLNYFTAQLETIRPFVEGIDGSDVADFLHHLQGVLKTADQLDAHAIVKRLKELLPPVLLAGEDKFDELITAIQNTGKELKEMLTDDFIDHLRHVVSFWPDFIATVPSWKHIIGVFFTSLLFTSTSLPKFFSAVKTINQVILEQKGVLAYVLTLLPLLLLTALTLPFNIAIQLGIQFTWILTKAAFHILTNGLKLLFSAINILRSVFTDADISFSQQIFNIFESIINLTLRLTFNIFFEALDEIIFILTNHSLLSSLQNGFNDLLDWMVDSMRPHSHHSSLQSNHLAIELIPDHTPPHEAKTEYLEEDIMDEAAPAYGFFSETNLALHNSEDVWLNELLADIAVDQDTSQTPGMSMAG